MHIRLLLSAILIVFIQMSVFAQAKTCDVRLNIFSAQRTEHPLSMPIKNAAVTMVNLANNKSTTAQIIDGNPFFSKVSERQYNIVTSKSGYIKTSKILKLNCRIADEKRVCDEIVFMNEGDSRNSVQIDVAELSIDQSPPPVLGTPSKNFEPGKTYVNSSFLNERAVYLPVPILTAEGKEASVHYKKVQSILFAKVYVIGDESGKVMEAFYTDDNRFDKKLFPDILEKAKQAKFLPFKLDGKPVGFSGVIFYAF